jgi:hypothetical protein
MTEMVSFSATYEVYPTVVGHFKLPLWPDSGPSTLWSHSEKFGAAFVRQNAHSTARPGKIMNAE